MRYLCRKHVDMPLEDLFSLLLIVNLFPGFLNLSSQLRNLNEKIIGRIRWNKRVTYLIQNIPEDLCTVCRSEIATNWNWCELY
ncbi:hypothetical protein AGOR_G00132590 [Albula goreensis]|uniref:Uncharacterized protein n=1 Tax=Albula goreensis TaxID=1534307 RepID=A0A8T3D443_9TELE|nr:hypothetical protein AGOR_G00132590 [Albula goreensis]